MITFQAVAQVLRGEDIEGLIGMGAPADEYDDEAAEIGSAIGALPESKIGEATIASIMALVWERKFGLSADELQKRLPAIQVAAKKMFALNK